MKGRLQCILDVEGVSPIPEGFKLVETEKALWQAFVGTESIWVRGNSILISWAAKALQGRGWEIQTKVNEFRPLIEKFPFLGPHLQELLSRSRFSSKNISIDGLAQSVLEGLPVEDIGTANHLLNFLIWDIHQELDLPQQAVRQAIIENWANQQAVGTEFSYKKLKDMDSDSHLTQWMSLDSQPRRGKWLQFPDISETGMKTLTPIVYKAVRSLLLNKNTNQLREFFTSEVSYGIKSCAFKVICDALRENIEVIIVDDEFIELMMPFAHGEDFEFFSTLIPPSVPISLPNTLKDLPRWFHEEYLPYRSWSVLKKETSSQERLQSIWKSFSTWYLERLHAAINGGNGASELAYIKVRDLWQQAENSPVLLIILDGVLPGDERIITDLIRKNNSEWEVTGKTFAATLIPTITEICKVSLIQGCPPHISNGIHKEIRLRLEAISATKSAMNKGNGYVIWAFNEPDWTYHSKSDSPEVTRYEVSKKLTNIAKDITSLLDAIPKGQDLSIVITSDHGRTLGGCPRRLSIPANSKSHDRVVQTDEKYSGEGTFYVDDQEIIHIDEEAFGVGKGTAMISTTDLVFSNSTTGNAWYVHGGILPEEALVPWLTLSRAKSETKITGDATLEGILGRKCKLSLELSNPNEVQLEIIKIRLRGTGLVPVTSELDKRQIGPLGSLKENIEVLIEGDASNAPELTVEVKKPSGEMLTFKIPLFVRLRAMQERGVDLNEDF